MKLILTKEWNTEGNFIGWTFRGDINGKYMSATSIVQYAHNVMNRNIFISLVKKHGGTMLRSRSECMFETSQQATDFIETLEPYLLAAKLQE